VVFVMREGVIYKQSALRRAHTGEPAS